METNNIWKLKALMKKNYLILKRNIVSTLFEILFPIVLMFLSYGIRKAFKLEKFKFEKEEGTLSNYIQNKSISNFDYSSIPSSEINTDNPIIPTWYGLSFLPELKICSMYNSNFEPRPLIATIGIDSTLKTKIMADAARYKSFFNLDVTIDNFKDFRSIDEMNNYITSTKYGQDNYPLICFGMRLEKKGDHNYEYSLHYFDSVLSEGVKDIDNAKNGLFDRFQSGPDLDSYKLYQSSGYTYIMKLIGQYILQQETDSSARIDYAIVPMPYVDYRSDPFSKVIGYMIPFFIIIAYMCPLCLYVYRMVGEKENKSKEGMKIMGLSEGTYFLSYFIQYFIISFIVSIINTIILTFIFTKIPFYFLFMVLFFWTMDLFAMIYLFQSFIDKTRVALILSLLIYFASYFLSMACMDEGASKILKIIMSILPPVCIELGIVLLGKFESHFKQFHPADYTKIYTNYSIFIMNLMQLIDFFLFLFLGYYLENVLPHEFGIRKPFYFLCTSEYWCRNKNKANRSLQQINEINIEINDDYKINEENIYNSQNKKLKELKQLKGDKYNPLLPKQNFEGEELYKERTKPDDSLRIRNIVKIFGDGKKAVDNVNLNFYKDEIFALLGHNGAGKTTLISMLTGLYEATQGTAFYDGYDILDSNNMDKFRKILGICPQHDVLFDDLTIREHLEMFCIFKGYASNDINGEINKTIHDFELDNIQNIIAKNLSAGQRRKLSIAISLIGGSKVIFLDEPSSGMDITSRRNLWDILKRQSEQKIIILTTHYMEEASVLGKRIGIINAGKMKCIGTPLFLIERFGKFMSLNITKETQANNEKIVNFIRERTRNLEYEILSEEIMFRIPKENYTCEGINDENLFLSENDSQLSNKKHKVKNTTPSDIIGQTPNVKEKLNLLKFFEDLDANLTSLNIKSYSASMPTLEDVFLNVAAEDTKFENQKLHRKFSSPDQENDKLLFETDFMENYSQKSKFCNDFYACFHRRYLLTIRDVKGFLMEILCPIILCVIGLLVSKVDFHRASGKQYVDMGAIGKQIVLYGKTDNNINLENYYFENMKNISCETLDFDNAGDYKDNINNFVSKVFERVKDKEDSIEHEVDMMDDNYEGIYGAYLMLEDFSSKHYKFIEVINARVKHGIPIYTHFFLKKLIEKASSNNVEINFIHYPLPLTAQLEEQRGQMNNNLVIFFIAIALALIPANFITIIVKERKNNSKHLMRVSGINIIAYWIVNYIFELFKYYFTCGFCLLFLKLFDFYRDYLYILYIIYGPAVVSVTYILSFLFDSESGAQNGIILLNFLVGALGSVIILLLRALDNVKTMAKVIEYIIALLPSFCFNFGYCLLLNKIMIYVVDYPDDWYFFEESEIIKHFNLLLSMIIYLCIESILYTVILVIIEWMFYRSFKEIDDGKIGINTNDSNVLKEIEKANENSGIIRVTTEKESDNFEYAVRVKNLRKVYSTGCRSEPTVAIKNMCFCVEPGECFGLLGLNGAGKTTTFKCITQEIMPDNGKIYINGIDMRNNFNRLSSIFGYCPQFDAIFEYMTVYENLEFYAKIKGVKKDYLQMVVNAMIQEMSLGEFTNKIASRLSGGNKRKLSVAISFLCSPSIVLLDEPSTGMDPEARRFMWSVIHKISTKGKKASVIMTTHSMDEAETLCKRMAIMVNGEFVCMGKAGEIKERYGYGYEIEVRIKPLSEKKFQNILNENSLDKNIKINMDNIEEILTKLGKQNFISELSQERLGSKLIRDIHINNDIPIRTLISWTFFVKNALKFIKEAQKYFETIILNEHIDNNFLFKMKKNNETKSIGFFFGLFESNKDNCYVTEYSIHQTSLEQIFYKFEEEKGNHGVDEINNKENKKQEIIINDEIFNSLLK